MPKEPMTWEEAYKRLKILIRLDWSHFSAAEQALIIEKIEELKEVIVGTTKK